MTSGWTPPTTSDHGLDELLRLLNQANVIVHAFDGVISHWSAGCEAMYGWRRDEAVGMVIHNLLATQFSEPVDQIRAALRTVGTWKGELIHRHKRGHMVPVSSQLSCSALGSSDNLVIV